MALTLRIATFNLEELDDGPGVRPPLATRIALMRPQLERIDADVLCLQEVFGQDGAGDGNDGDERRRLKALEELLKTTRYEDYRQVSTHLSGDPGRVLKERNLVILSRKD